MSRFSDLIRQHPTLASVLLGALAACGFAPFELWPLTILCLAAWALILHDAPTLKQSLWRGWAFGVGHFTINDNWFQHAFDFQDRMPAVLGYVAPLALALYLAVYPALAAGLAWRFRRARPDPGYALALGAAWIVAEWLRATMFTGYAWDPIGVIWVPVQPVAGLSAWIGTYALSGLTVAAAAAILLVPPRLPAIGGVVAGLALLMTLQAFSYLVQPPPARRDDAPRLRIVQPNVGLDPTGQSDAELLLTRLTALSARPGPAPRLLLWPEGVIRQFVEDGYPFWAYSGSDPRRLRARMAATLGPRDLLLTGGEALQFDAKGDISSATNSVFAIRPDATIQARYDKAHLVPYGEYLPMPWLFRPLGLDRLIPGDFDFLAGPGPRTIAFPGFGAIGFQTCYEIIFSGEVVDPAHRPRLIFNPSSDAWFGKWGPPQHLAQARMRAIEEGLPVIRATPTGISGVIAADGRLVATVPHEIMGAIELPIPAALPPTLFSRAGNWMATIVALLLVAGAVAVRRRGR